jgi:hypothetical protein
MAAPSDAPNSEEKKDILKGKNFYPSGMTSSPHSLPCPQDISLFLEGNSRVSSEKMEEMSNLNFSRNAPSSSKKPSPLTF